MTIAFRLLGRLWRTIRPPLPPLAPVPHMHRIVCPCADCRAMVAEMLADLHARQRWTK